VFSLPNILIVLAGACPFLMPFDNAIVAGLIALCAALCLGACVRRLRPGEAGHLLSVIRWPLAIAALPLLWMVLQLAPLPFGGLSHSIWSGAAGALDAPLSGSVTLDTGKTVLAIANYATAIAILFASAAFSLDRGYAERLLLAAGFGGVIAALGLLLYEIGALPWLADPGAAEALAALIAATAYGAMFCASVAIMIVERFETRRSRGGIWSAPLVNLAICIAALAICCLAVTLSGARHATLATGCGLAALAVIYLTRRLGLGRWAAPAMGLVAIACAFIVVADLGHPADGDFSVRYAAAASPGAVAEMTRNIGEVGAAGAGAGTFDAVSRLLGTLNDGHTAPPTFAAKIVIELGKPALWIFLAGALATMFFCARGAMTRGRDSFFPAAGTGIGIMAIVMSFGDPATANPAIAAVIACAIGLGLAQSASRKI
jgi:hypothetical protein